MIKRLLLRCIHHFKSDLIDNMDLYVAFGMTYASRSTLWSIVPSKPDIKCCSKQNRESTAGYSRLKIGKRPGKFERTTLNNCIVSKSQKAEGAEPGVREGKRSLVACQTRYKWSTDTNRNMVKVKLGIRVMKLEDNLFGWEVTVTGQVSECHLTLVRGDSILLHKFSASIIKRPEWRLQVFHEVSVFE